MNEFFETRDFLIRAENFQKRIGYRFLRPELLQLAFVQRSSEKSQLPSQNNERLEFLGDAAIGLIVGAAIYGEYPEADEGFMTIERSNLVCGQNLSAWGYEAGFDRMICAGEGVAISAAMVEDSVEAVAGALFIDGGLDAVNRFLQSFSDYPDRGMGFDARYHLERVCGLEKLGLPKYRTRPRFANGGMVHESTVTLKGEETGTGLGKTRQEAERNAARDALGRLNRVSAGEQQKRAAVRRAHFRRVIASRAASEKRPAFVTLSDSEKEASRAAKQSAVVGVFKDGRRIVVRRGTSKAAATRTVPQPVREQTMPDKKKSVADYLANIDLAALRASPDLKGALQTCCERLGLGQPEYADVPQTVKWKTPVFTIDLKLKGVQVATGRGTSKKAASQIAAWKTMQLLASGLPGEPAAWTPELESLAERLERAFNDTVTSRGESAPKYDVTAETERGVAFSCRITSADRTFAEAPGDDERQARLHAVVKAATQRRLWPAVLNRLEISQTLDLSGGEGRPESVLDWRLKKDHRPDVEEAVIRLDGSKQTPRFRLGFFLENELLAGMTGPNKKVMETLLALLILDRMAQKRPLTTPVAVPSQEKEPEETSARERKKKPEEGLKKRVVGWFRRIADAHIKN